MIYKALATNSTLKVLDISWNTIGNGMPTAVPNVCEFFKTNKTIVHLDMSNNNFSYDETVEISKTLPLNRTIYGLHFIGNFGFFFINYIIIY